MVGEISFQFPYEIKRRTDTPRRPVNIEYQERKAELHRRRKEKWERLLKI